jgi:integrase
LFTHVERLAAAAVSGHVTDAETSRWVSNLDSVLADKLANVGLIARQERATLAAFIDGYIAKRTDVAERTATNYRHAQCNLIEFFGADKPLRDILPGDADEFRLYLLEKGLADDSTVPRRCGYAKQFFNAAQRKGLIDRNPFVDLPSVVQANATRFHFVTREDSQKIIDACPDAQWRLLFALSRYGGLRCPSEHLTLRWGDVDWERDRIDVQSPKTAHHAGGESRLMPLFPELRPFLEECFELAEPGTEHVITMCRDTGKNFRTAMKCIIKRAGLKPWPKLFMNLRSTRETELAEEYPMHVVCAWIGNSQAVAAKHYLQVTDDHFSKAVQNPVQQAAEPGCTGLNSESDTHDKTPVLQGSASTRSSVQDAKPVTCGSELSR